MESVVNDIGVVVVVLEGYFWFLFYEIFFRFYY